MSELLLWPFVAGLVLTGTEVASAIAPYLGVALRGVDPRVPFIVSTLTLLATVVGLMLAEKRLPANPPAEPKPLPPVASPALFAALLLLALGFQVHFSLSSAPRYVQFAPREQLPYLMPVFWVGFNLLMFPAARVVKRLGVAEAMALAAALGALAMLLTVFAPGLAVLVAAQFLAGGCWGAASVAAYSAVVALGRTGRSVRAAQDRGLRRAGAQAHAQCFPSAACIFLTTIAIVEASICALRMSDTARGTSSGASVLPSARASTVQ